MHLIADMDSLRSGAVVALPITVGDAVVDESSKRIAAVLDKENISHVNQDARRVMERKRKQPLSTFDLASNVMLGKGDTIRPTAPVLPSKKRALARSSSTPSPSSASYRGSLANSFKEAATAAAASVVHFGGKHNQSPRGLPGHPESTSEECDRMAVRATKVGFCPGIGVVSTCLPLSTKSDGIEDRSVKVDSSAGGLGLGSVLFGGHGPSGPLERKPFPAAGADTDLVLARLGSLGDIRLHSPVASPKHAQDMEGEDGETMALSSPFNEGYALCRGLPEDASLKSGLCFESARPFDWCRAISGAIEANGMLCHLRESLLPTPTPSLPREGGALEAGLVSVEAALETWVAASFLYVYPLEPLDTSLHLPLHVVRKRMENAFVRDPISVSGTEIGRKQDQAQNEAIRLYKRLREWEEAFRHLYTLYRHNPSLTFYLQAPDFTVVWTREEEGARAEEGRDGESECHLKAVVSHSKRWLRSRLREAGIAFDVPLAPEAEVRDMCETFSFAGSDSVGKYGRESQGATTKGAQGKDGMQDNAKGAEEELELLLSSMTGQLAGGAGMVEMESRRRAKHLKDLPQRRSQLVLRGHLAVHGLFSLLLDLENGMGPTQVGDVPRLLAGRAFMHGAMQRLKVTFNGQVQRSLGMGARGGREVDTRGMGLDDTEEVQGGWRETHAEGVGMETVYQLKLRGPVLPEQLRRLAGVVHFMQLRDAKKEVEQKGKGVQEGIAQAKAGERDTSRRGDWSLIMESLHGTEAFNYRVGGDCTRGRVSHDHVRCVKEVRWSAEKHMFAVITC